MPDFNRLCQEGQTAHLLHHLFQHHDYTYFHSLRVAQYSYQIASYIGLSDIEKVILTRSALLHDIGKLYIDHTILNKSSRLTSEEFELIKAHPVLGMEVLKVNHYKLEIDPDVVLYHHENLDGTGYPIGLKSSRLSANVRIVRIADSFDAMTTSRSYNTVKNITEAKLELHHYKQRIFCPDILNVFDRYVTEQLNEVALHV